MLNAALDGARAVYLLEPTTARRSLPRAIRSRIKGLAQSKPSPKQAQGSLAPQPRSCFKAARLLTRSKAARLLQGHPLAQKHESFIWLSLAIASSLSPIAHAALSAESSASFCPTPTV